MIKIGFSQCDFFSEKDHPSYITIEHGEVIFKGYANIGAGCKISINGGSNLQFGNQTWITGPVLIIARKSIILDDNCILSWNITIMDHDAHNIIVNNKVSNVSKGIHIGKRCWIGFNTTILKGSIIPENTIIAAQTMITQSTTGKNNSIIAGIPGKVISEHVEWK